MDEKKTIVVAGVHLGDIAIALAGLQNELPTYVKGLDFGLLLEGAEGLDAIEELVDRAMGQRGERAQPIKSAADESSGGPSKKSQPSKAPRELVQAVLDRALEMGKFLSAGRCLDMLGERDAYVEKFLSKGIAAARKGDRTGAAAALVTAANLGHRDGIPMFQYSGPALHDMCAASTDSCVTRLEEENAVLKAFKYLLQSEKVYEAVAELSPDERRSLLPSVATERDPETGEFMKRLEEAHRELGRIEQEDLAALKATVAEIVRQVGEFSGNAGRMMPGSEEAKNILDRTVRTAAGLAKEFSDADGLVDGWQLRRLERRLEQLIESGDDIDEARKVLGGGAKKGDSALNVLAATADLIRRLKDEDILKRVEETEKRLIAIQVTLLGRSVHSQEHWQYMRELAFKHPASPLVCCLRKIDDRHMVVPMWDAPITRLLTQK
jgi:hypothetical protein